MFLHNRSNKPGFDDLPDELLIKIFGKLRFATRRTILPLVCKQWLQFTERAADLWAEVIISGAEEEAAFKILQLSGQTGGLELSGDASLSIRQQPIARWFQRHPAAAISKLEVGRFSPPEERIILALHPGALNATLSALRGSLEHLILEDSSWIRAAPYLAELGWLTRLKTLHLSFLLHGGPTRLTAPDIAVLAGLTDLESLKISAFDLVVSDSFPDAFFRLPRLKCLKLTNIEGSGFADRLGRLTGLTSLKVGGTKSEGLVSAQQAATLEGLVILDLSYNLDLDQLPDLSALRALRTLRCIQTGFRSLPVAQLRALTAINEIDFSLCSEMVVLETLPELVGLDKLRFLSLQGCKQSDSGVLYMMQF